METHRCVQFQGHLVNYKHYEELFDFAKTKPITLGYHLSESHIHPNNFQKMNVRLSAQLFSNKTAMAFNVLRNYKEDTDVGRLIKSTFKGVYTEKIERLTKVMNDVFYILNLRFCKVRITKDTFPPKKEKLNHMLQVLSETEHVYEENGRNIPMFVSQTSLHAWRLSIRSAINLIEEQFDAGLKGVLTGKFNQEPLERLFGIVRSVDKEGTRDFKLNVMAYDLCGYIVKTRKHLTACEACKNLVRCTELDLPKDFTADQYTAMRNHGYPVYVTVPFLKPLGLLN
ncbi:Uncharacterized protein APZ42_030122 [Daphnia magna]|uniref:Transposable element P transposase-like GTP-binding insertion domain-containing protein n=1 Tax=Daphnia magna TaxID=35525 RepID=A0A164P1I9_9CRUS|nr:Uncharacterized protein APZ42_030122 [Daphnia magna]